MSKVEKEPTLKAERSEAYPARPFGSRIACLAHAVVILTEVLDEELEGEMQKAKLLAVRAMMKGEN